MYQEIYVLLVLIQVEVIIQEMEMVRMIGRTYYALGDATQGIEPTHYHVYSYNEYSSGETGGAMPLGDHIPGEFDPVEWASGWEFLL